MYEGEVMRALVCSACAEVTNDDSGSRRACVMLGGHAECGGRAAPAAQAARSNCSHSAKVANYRLATLAGTRVVQTGMGCICHVLALWRHVGCKTTPAGRIQRR